MLHLYLPNKDAANNWKL